MKTRVLVALALALAVGLATAVAPFASSSPDGLERVAADEAFLDRAHPAAVHERSPIAGYAFPGIGDERVATGAAGFAGTLLVLVIGHGLTRVLRRRPRSPAAG